MDSPHSVDINRSAPVQARAELFIGAPPDLVWSTLADLESWPAWNGEVSRMKLRGPVAPDTRFDWNAGGMSIKSRILVADRPGLLGWSGKTFGTRAVHLSRFVADGAGTNAITEESFEGFIPWAFRGPTRNMLLRSLESGLLALKAESERRA